MYRAIHCQFCKRSYAVRLEDMKLLPTFDGQKVFLTCPLCQARREISVRAIEFSREVEVKNAL